MPAVGFRHSPQSVARMRASRRAQYPSLRERFEARHEPDLNGGCWLWTGALMLATDYGTIQYQGRTYGAHRVSYELHRGPISDGMCVCHRCDVRACVNPAHLFLGTHRDNILDMHRKGRARTPIGDDHVGSKLRATDIRGVLERLNGGEPCARIAQDFGLTDCAINAIRRGKSWRHVTGPLVFGSNSPRQEEAA